MKHLETENVKHIVEKFAETYVRSSEKIKTRMQVFTRNSQTSKNKLHHERGKRNYKSRAERHYA